MLSGWGEPPQQLPVPSPSATATNLMLEHFMALEYVQLQPFVRELHTQVLPMVLMVHCFELSQ